MQFLFRSFVLKNVTNAIVSFCSLVFLILRMISPFWTLWIRFVSGNLFGPNIGMFLFSLYFEKLSWQLQVSQFCLDYYYMLLASNTDNNVLAWTLMPTVFLIKSLVSLIYVYYFITRPKLCRRVPHNTQNQIIPMDIRIFFQCPAECW